MAAWFGPKRTGIGAMPRRWQGWFVTFMLVAGLVLDVRFFHPAQFGLPDTYKPLSLIVIAAVYLLIIKLTYDPDA